MNTVTKGWICTDSDSLQYVKQESKSAFSFKQFNDRLLNPILTDKIQYLKDRDKMNTESFVEKYWKDESLWIAELIDVDEYNEEDIKEIMESYGYEYEDGVITDKSGSAFVDFSIVAECIFEYESFD